MVSSEGLTLKVNAAGAKVHSYNFDYESVTSLTDLELKVVDQKLTEVSFIPEKYVRVYLRSATSLSFLCESGHRMYFQSGVMSCVMGEATRLVDSLDHYKNVAQGQRIKFRLADQILLDVQ